MHCVSQTRLRRRLGTAHSSLRLAAGLPFPLTTYRHWKQCTLVCGGREWERCCVGVAALCGALVFHRTCSRAGQYSALLSCFAIIWICCKRSLALFPGRLLQEMCFLQPHVVKEMDAHKDQAHMDQAHSCLHPLAEVLVDARGNL